MKYLYKKHKKLLLMLLFLLSMTYPAVAQVPGTPYGMTAVNQVTFLPGSGTLGGRTCFDVAQINDGAGSGSLSHRQAHTVADIGGRADFTTSTTRIQTYKFIASGTVSNVRLSYVEADAYQGQIIESISGGNPGNNISPTDTVTCTVVYQSDLNTKAAGKTRDNALTVDIYAAYNDSPDGTGTDRAVKLTAMIRDWACCGAYTYHGTWLEFMCYNLGADETLSTPGHYEESSFESAAGALFYWGKPAAYPFDRSGSAWTWIGNNDLNAPGYNTDTLAWAHNGTKTQADPCPNGWRIPSLTQWRALCDDKWNNGSGITRCYANRWTLRRATPRQWYTIGYDLNIEGYTFNNDPSETSLTVHPGDVFLRGLQSATNANAILVNSNGVYSGLWGGHVRFGRAVRCVKE